MSTRFALLAAALVALVGITAASCGRVPAQPDNTFPLIGLHVDVSCEACHPSDRPIEQTPTLCMGCHEEAQPPDHYVGDCGICHTEFGWSETEVDHIAWLDLSGRHTRLDCFDCHMTGTFFGLDPSCGSCHEQDRPTNHFTGACETCHQVSDWIDANFDHSQFFPVPHEGVSSCSSCHLDSTTYSSFSCTHCHEHRASEMNDEHDDVGGYSWNSSACLDCHPQGREEDDD